MKSFLFGLLSLFATPIASFYTATYDYGNFDATATVEIDESNTEVTITLTVDSSRWVGLGFGNTMKNTVAIICSGTDSTSERQLQTNSAGTAISSPSFTVVSDTVSNGVRTIVVTRPADAGSSFNYYDFSSISDGDSVDIIMGIGSGTTFSQHTSRKKNIFLTFSGPTSEPSESPTYMPSVPSYEPTYMPSSYPTVPSAEPTYAPIVPGATEEPSSYPSKSPTNLPTVYPTISPTFAAEVASASFNSSDAADDDLSAQISVLDDDSVLLQLSGPAGQWIGFGFGAKKMDGTYAIIVDGNGLITERTLADSAPGTELEASEYEEIRNEAIDGVRQVLLKADVNDFDNYDFSALVGATSLDYIIASSPDVSLAIHSWREFGEAAIEVSVAQTDDDDAAQSGNVTSTQSGDDLAPVADAAGRIEFGVLGLSAWVAAVGVVVVGKLLF